MAIRSAMAEQPLCQPADGIGVGELLFAIAKLKPISTNNLPSRSTSLLLYWTLDKLRSERARARGRARARPSSEQS